MSRFHDCEWDGEGAPPEFWWQAVKNALRGRKGQAVLRELREALLALPEKRLIEGFVACDGEVCAIGALAAHRLTKGPITLKGSFFEDAKVESLEDLQAQFVLDDDILTTEFGQSMGLVRALAWAISYEDAKPLAVPIPVKGRLGIYRWRETPAIATMALPLENSRE